MWRPFLIMLSCALMIRFFGISATGFKWWYLITDPLMILLFLGVSWIIERTRSKIDKDLKDLKETLDGLERQVPIRRVGTEYDLGKCDCGEYPAHYVGEVDWYACVNKECKYYREICSPVEWLRMHPDKEKKPCIGDIINTTKPKEP